jgi:glycosyltransferase involved in cell wall biosynthesis
MIGTDAAVGAKPEVSILIPAYAAENFIDRTLSCARAQTESRVLILVSVDASGDQTGRHVTRHAEEDPRIKLYTQKQRLGWVGNVNFLLDRVATPFFFLYFHDDIIRPEYVAKLLEALMRRPDAASVHCNVGNFGGRNHVQLGSHYDGSPVERLLRFLLTPSRGAPLRSLMRSAAVKHLRHCNSSVAWMNEPFLMELMAAGPAVHVDETLYLRWDRRRGGVTDQWRKLAPETALAAHRANLEAGLHILDNASQDAAEREVLRYALALRLLKRLHRLEKCAGRPLFTTIAELHPEFAGLHPPASLGSFGPEIRKWAHRRWGDVQQNFGVRIR